MCTEDTEGMVGMVGIVYPGFGNGVKPPAVEKVTAVLDVVVHPVVVDVVVIVVAPAGQYPCAALIWSREDVNPRIWARS